MSPNRVFARVITVALALVGALLLASLWLIVLGAGPARSGAWVLRCLIAPVSSIDTGVHLMAVVTVGVGGLVCLLGVRTFNHERAKAAELRNALRRVRLTPSACRVATAAAVAAVSGRVDIVASSRPFAFAYGWVRPRICVSTGLVDCLADDELVAVLLHESWHAARRDPLRLLVVRTIGAAFAFIPAVRRLVDHFVLSCEVAADRYVVAAMGHPRSLANAMIKIVPLLVASPAFGGHTEARIAALAGEPLPTESWRGRLAAAVLALEVVVLVPLLVTFGAPQIIGIWLHPLC